MYIRFEQADDNTEVEELHKLACKEPQQSKSNKLCRASHHKTLSPSLVALEQGKVLAHLGFSEIRISDGSQGWYRLGAIAVLPEKQGQGIASAIIKSGLKLLQRQGAAGCIVLGNSHFYKRFNFKPTAKMYLQSLSNARLLAQSFSNNLPEGEVTYAPKLVQPT
ncbi:GNAT family N-acetyltransferase [Agaribacterium sp. ZY112]|uniref:GNAT family N-acetyltransferase n=1 Tax=Agaribacterium sp. ZY112 TaxID=3233574 RepID=UPI003524CC42